MEANLRVLTSLRTGSPALIAVLEHSIAHRARGRDPLLSEASGLPARGWADGSRPRGAERLERRSLLGSPVCVRLAGCMSRQGHLDLHGECTMIAASSPLVAPRREEL